jgi:hypothetical protein
MGLSLAAECLEDPSLELALPARRGAASCRWPGRVSSCRGIDCQPAFPREGQRGRIDHGLDQNDVLLGGRSSPDPGRSLGAPQVPGTRPAVLRARAKRAALAEPIASTGPPAGISGAAALPPAFEAVRSVGTLTGEWATPPGCAPWRSLFLHPWHSTAESSGWPGRQQASPQTGAPGYPGERRREPPDCRGPAAGRPATRPAKRARDDRSTVHVEQALLAHRIPDTLPQHGPKISGQPYTRCWGGRQRPVLPRRPRAIGSLQEGE